MTISEDWVQDVTEIGNTICTKGGDDERSHDKIRASDIGNDNRSLAKA